jgi:peptide deformylase
MIVKETTQVGNKVIRDKAVEVVNPKSKSVQKVVTDLVDSMRHHELVGMAAPQIGKGIRVFVTEIRETKLRKGDAKNNIDPLRVFINPQIISVSKTHKSGWEGCGSVASANLFGMVKRPTSVVIEAVDENGNYFKLKAQNLLARVIQHEMDHLNGVVFVDKADTHTYMSRNEYLKLRRKKSKK